METHEIGGLILIAEADTRTCLRDKKTPAVEAEDSDDIGIVSRPWLSRFLHEMEQLNLNWKTMDPDCGRNPLHWIQNHRGAH